MTDTALSTFDSLMDSAYNRWQANQKWTKEEFWDQLDAKERFAVFMGNMNYQIENGGFGQWWGNNYATQEVVGYITRTCKKMDTEASKKVAELVKKFWKIVGETDYSHHNDDADMWEELESADLDSEYYAVNTQFLDDCETFLKEWKI